MWLAADVSEHMYIVMLMAWPTLQIQIDTLIGLNTRVVMVSHLVIWVRGSVVS